MDTNEPVQGTAGAGEPEPMAYTEKDETRAAEQTATKNDPRAQYTDQFSEFKYTKASMGESFLDYLEELDDLEEKITKVLTFLGYAFLTPLILKVAWNRTIPKVFDAEKVTSYKAVGKITYWQAFGLTVISEALLQSIPVAIYNKRKQTEKEAE